MWYSGRVVRGATNWSGVGRRGEDWVRFIFRIDGFDGDKRNDERDLEWHAIDRIESLPRWEGGRYFLPMGLSWSTTLRAHFMATCPCANDGALDWRYIRA